MFGGLFFVVNCCWFVHFPFGWCHICNMHLREEPENVPHLLFAITRQPISVANLPCLFGRLDSGFFLWKTPHSHQPHPGISVSQPTRLCWSPWCKQHVQVLSRVEVKNPNHPFRSTVLESPLQLWTLSSWEDKVLTQAVDRRDCRILSLCLFALRLPLVKTSPTILYRNSPPKNQRKILLSAALSTTFSASSAHFGWTDQLIRCWIWTPSLPPIGSCHWVTW